MLFQSKDDDPLTKVSRKLNKDDIFRLASKLEISEKEVNNSFVKHSKIHTKTTEAILAQWMKKQSSREDAYLRMGKALTHTDVGLNLIAKEVLNYPNTEKKSKRNPTKQGESSKGI